MFDMKVYKNTPHVAFSAVSGSFISRHRQAAMAAFPPTSDATARSRPSFKRVEVGAPAATAPDALFRLGLQLGTRFRHARLRHALG
jgi:hypothetical protein